MTYVIIHNLQNVMLHSVTNIILGRNYTIWMKKHTITPVLQQTIKGISLY